MVKQAAAVAADLWTFVGIGIIGGSLSVAITLLVIFVILISFNVLGDKELVLGKALLRYVLIPIIPLIFVTGAAAFLAAFGLGRAPDVLKIEGESVPAVLRTGRPEAAD